MALAPPSKLSRDIWKTRYAFETLNPWSSWKTLIPVPALLFIWGLEFIEVHGPDGQRAFLNPKAISSLREPVGTDLKHFTGSVRCVVVTTNGKFIAVVETCPGIRDTLDKKP
jgi:hypothetical protein